MASSEVKLDPLVEILADMITSALRWETEHPNEVPFGTQTDYGLTDPLPGIHCPPTISQPAHDPPGASDDIA